MYSLETIIALNNPSGITRQELEERARPKYVRSELRFTANDLAVFAELGISVDSDDIAESPESFGTLNDVYAIKKRLGLIDPIERELDGYLDESL